jgi:hypothetical protein
MKGKYVAETFVAPSPEAEVIGQGFLALVNNLQSEDIKPFLKQYQLEAIEGDKWYPMQLVLDIEKAMVEAKVNATQNLVAIGISLVDTMPFPNVTTLEQAIDMLNTMISYGTRNIPEESRWYVAESEPGHVLVTMNMPYPADAVFGYLWGIARRFKPANTKFSVKQVENPKPAEFPGVAFEIRWEMLA